MAYLLSFTLAALILKDALYLGPISEGLRLLAPAVSGVAGLAVIVTAPARIQWLAYWATAGYLLVAMIPIPESYDPPYVLFQVASIAAITIGAIAASTTPQAMVKTETILFRSITAFFALALMASLVVMIVLPERAYEVLITGEVRFRGVFSEPAALGVSAALLAGIGWFGFKQRIFRIGAIALGVACLLLTQSRTPIAAGAIAAAFTWYLYSRHRAMTALLAVVGLGFVALGVTTFDLRPDQQTVARLTRLDTVATLTGRTDLWKAGLEVAKERPFLGYGLTMGSIALAGRPEAADTDLVLVASATTRASARATLHNGYMQSILDSGLIGSFFYFAVIIGSIITVWRKDQARRHGAMMFSLAFLAVANLAENTIQTASVAYSALFWMLAAMALGMRPSHAVTEAPATLPDQPNRLGNLLR